MKTLTLGMYNAAKGAANYVQEKKNSYGDIVFGPSKISELALFESVYNGLDKEKNVFCDNDTIYRKIKKAHPDAKIEKITRHDLKGKRKADYRYVYVNGIDAYTDSRVVLVGIDPKTYEKMTLEDVKKMGYYAIPFVAVADARDRACINGQQCGLPSIGSDALPVPIEVVKGSENVVRNQLRQLFMDEYGMKSSMKARDIHIPVKSYPKDLSLLNLTFSGSTNLGDNLEMLEKEILKSHVDVKAVGIHSTIRPSVIMVGYDHGYIPNEAIYHELSSNLKKDL